MNEVFTESELENLEFLLNLEIDYLKKSDGGCYYHGCRWTTRDDINRKKESFESAIEKIRKL